MKKEVNVFKIDYEYGTALLYTPRDNWKDRFNKLAGQCFGIRKSIGDTRLISQTTGTLYKGYEKLEHGGDVIIWDKNGKKIKSEWD